jgi:flavin reductase (DIM6/NTAB) family NADH-FMN oxidoreductase RutF
MSINGVSIILTGTNDDYQGMAIAWVSQVEKEHLIISVPKGSTATNLLLQREMFSVNELGIGQDDLARQFGGKNCTIGNSANLSNINATEYNLPILSNCCSSTICKVLYVNEINEQIVVTAKVINSVKQLDLDPLIFNKSDYFN